MEEPKTTVAIVDNHTLFRQGLAHLLAKSNKIDVIFDAADGAEMIKKLHSDHLPEVILMDINMPVMNGYESTKWIKQHYPQIKVLALSMFEDDKPVIEMLKCGAGGYIFKQTSAADLIFAIRSIAKHSFFINNVVSGKLLNNIQNNGALPTGRIELSANELKFLELSCSDLTYKQIAGLMNLSPFTINNYREALFERFDTKSRTGLVVSALKRNLIKLT